MPYHPPQAVRNTISLAGAVIATTMAGLFIVLLVLDGIGAIDNPYAGLLIFITIPVLFIFGLLLIPTGSWMTARRRRTSPDSPEWPVIDLGNPRHRTVAVLVVALTIVNVALVSMAVYGGIHYMDSSQFCGEVCHTTMEPQYVARQSWPHSKVECAQCHIGPGARALVQAKMAGTRQLFLVLTDQVPKPVQPPTALIQQPDNTCERCHATQQVRGDTLRVIREYANDEQNSESTTTLRLHVGAGSATSRIHWHADPGRAIDFATGGEKNDTIPYVRLTEANGHVQEFVVDSARRSQFAAASLRRMDCLDCHNRPAHTMSFTAARAVDRAVAEGRIPRELPFVRREAVAAVSEPYQTRDAGMQAIAKHLRDFYAARPGVDRRLVERAVVGAGDAWSHNVFPAMRVTWGTYPNNLGHVDTPGCFRCHDDEHKSADGRVIRQDCELCHTAPE